MLKALIVDDIAQNLYFLRTLLSANGYQVESAGNGAEALALAEKATPDLIITDLLMPVMDGFTFCRACRSRPALAAVPIVVYTATYTDPSDEKLALDQGADLFLVKPLDVEELMKAISELLQKRAAGLLARHHRLAPPEVFIQQYNATLIRKLEQKLAELDASDRKRKESEERLRQAVRVSNIGIFDHDHISQTIYASPRDREINGLDPTEPISLEAFIARVHPGDRERIAAAVNLALNPDGDGLFDVENRLLLPDGSVRWTSTRAQTFFEGEGTERHPTRTIGAVRDITKRKQAEEQQLQAQKLESIGRLAGGVAHDFNNLLTVINGYSTLILSRMSAGDPLREAIKSIQNAGESATALTRQLLAFSRKQLLEPRLLDVNRMVEGIRPQLEHLLGEGVEVRVALDEASGAVHADPHQLERVIINLAVNARHAMPNGGCFSIETASAELPQSQEGAKGRYFLLKVSDNGEGMNEETRRRIFEPFFTTRPAGTGTGLGLATVQGIVAQSGGQIEVFSEPGLGTTFHIYLPVVAGTAVARARPASATPLGGSETILVVEDLTAVRDYVVMALASYGYRMISAGSAREALRIVAQESGPIHLVLTDVVMPDVGGPEMVEQLEKVRPEVKVLYMSGYTDNLMFEPVHFIEKPFSPEELAGKVRELLGAISA
jgi:two-component system cell cycle sensor histidine kinase/response regulator CckA